MAWFRPEQGIGRGETPESQLEAPIFLGVAVLYCLALVLQHLVLGNGALTLALTVSGIAFGLTAARVDLGVYILIVSMLLSPEVELSDVAAGERALTLRYEDFLIIVIFLGVQVKLAFEGRFALWRPSPINAGIVAYFGVCLFATLLALQRALGAWDARSAAFVLLKMLQFYLVFWLVGHAIVNRDQMRRQLALFFAVAAVVSVYGIYSIGTTPRVSAPFETGGTEPNTLGGYLVICMCVALGLATQARTRGWQLALLALFALCGVPLLYTLSRASYTALLAGAAAIGVVSRRWWILAGLAAALALSPLIMPEEVIRRVQYTIQQDSGHEIVEGLNVDKSTGERLLVWRKVRYILTLAPVYALFGGGVGWESVLDSQYARVILESGLAGLAAFAFMQYRVLRTVREAYRWTEDWVGRGLAMGMFGASLALIVHSLGTISFLIVRIMTPFWLLTALCVFVRGEALAAHWARHTAARKAAPAPAAGGRGRGGGC